MLAFLGLGPFELTIIACVAVAIVLAPLIRRLRSRGEATAGEPMPESGTWKRVLFSYRGRIPRRVFWAANVTTLFVMYPVLFVLHVIENRIDTSEESSLQALLALMLLLAYLVFLVAAVWIEFAILAKRCHDLGLSGLWSLVTLIPLFGAIWALIALGCMKGTAGPNRYGPDPV